MALFKRRRAAEKRGVIIGTEGSYLSSAAGIDFGVNVTSDAALKMTAYLAGVRLISENIASLPKKVLRYTDSGLLPDDKSPVYRAINIRPNAYTNHFDFWFTIMAWFLNRGNAYAWIQYDYDHNRIELHQVHPDYVTVSIVNGHKWYKIQHPDSDFAFLNGEWPDYRMLHFMQFTLDGIVGINPVIYNAIALNKGLALEKYIANYFAKGGDKRAVMEMENSLGDDVYAKFVKRVQSAGTGGVPLLEYGVKYKQLGVDPVTAALIDSEVFSIDDVARMLNIPPHMLAEMSHSTFSNIEHQTIQFVQYTLRPIVKRLEVELETKLFSRSDADVKFILDGLLRGDTAARTAYYHQAVLDGWLTRNEAREMEGFEKKEGLDTFLYPQNEGMVGEENNDNI